MPGEAGRLLTVEGGEGSGKTTNIAFIASFLRQRGVSLVQTREPGGTPLAEELRHLLLAQRDEPVAPLTELLLIFAARAQHLQEVIRPALARGQWVLCDRFTDATYAYQGCGRAMGPDTVEQLEQLVQGALRPDLTLLLDLPVAAGMQRAGQRGAPDRFEAERTEFFERVRAGYLARARAQPDRFRVIAAQGDLASVQTQLQAALRPLLDGSPR